MNLTQILRIAGRALARNKLRSALTMLGIIIGVAAVIAMVSVGQGAQQQAQDQIAAMGSNVLFVGAGTVSRGGMNMGWGATKSLVYDDVTAILRECPAVKAAAPGTVSTGPESNFSNPLTNSKGKRTGGPTFVRKGCIAWCVKGAVSRVSAIRQNTGSARRAGTCNG